MSVFAADTCLSLRHVVCIQRGEVTHCTSRCDQVSRKEEEPVEKYIWTHVMTGRSRRKEVNFSTLKLEEEDGI